MGNARHSWGRYPHAEQQLVALAHRDAPLPAPANSLLPFGNGRSYGDVCLNDGGTLVLARGLDRFISFDSENGVLRCEAGVLLSEILDLAMPRGWVLPVIPGTQFVTVGGAIANDVHGKNHHRVGSFGAHVRCLEVLRSDGARVLCSARDNAELFGATIGGLGLTGLIAWAELQLVRSAGSRLTTRILPFRGIEEFLALSLQAETTHEHVVAWIDCAARGANAARGLLQLADPLASSDPPARRRRLSVPLTPPLALVRPWTVRAFNHVYYSLGRRRLPRTEDFRSFLFPLDAIGHWNRLYGPRGFLQFQCVVPDAAAGASLDRILRLVAESGSGSFLAVLKRMGDFPAAGLLSFPRAGVSLALDFPMRGAPTLALLRELESIVDDAGGAIYPAKDACMSAAHFQRAFPRWRAMREYRDPQFSSSFWRRVTENS